MRDELSISIDGELSIKYLRPQLKDPETDDKTLVLKSVCETSLNVEKLFIPYTGYQFNLINGTIVSFKLSDLYATRDGLANNNNPTLQSCLFYLFFGPTEKDVIIFSSKPIDYENVVLFEGPISVGQIAAKYYPELKNSVDAFKYKRQILTEIDPHTSLAYIETQLDLMCLVINTILDKDPEMKSYVESKLPLADIMSAVIDHNVSNVKEVSKCIEDVVATKSKIRTLQKQYLDTKNGVTNAS